MVLAAAAVHTHLVRKGLRSYASINVRSAEVLDTHAFAVLIGVGATTVHAYLAEAAIADRQPLPARRQDRRLNFVETRSEEHTSELQSLMRRSYAVFCLNTKIKGNTTTTITTNQRINIKKPRKGR